MPPAWRWMPPLGSMATCSPTGWQQGRAGQSYGLKVAALAGLPASVLARAEVLLSGNG